MACLRPFLVAGQDKTSRQLGGAPQLLGAAGAPELLQALQGGPPGFTNLVLPYYPLVNYHSYDKITIEIADLAINIMVVFHSYVKLPEGRACFLELPGTFCQITQKSAGSVLNSLSLRLQTSYTGYVCSMVGGTFCIYFCSLVYSS